MLSPAGVQQLALDSYLALLIGALAVGGIGCITFFGSLIRARIIEDTPTSRIRSAAQGYVELIGRFQPHPDTTVHARLTKTPCLWYRYKIERYQKTNKGGRWKKVDGGTSSAWFQLHDDTGVCIVDPTGAEVVPAVKKVWYGNTRWPTPGTGGVLGMLGSRYRYTEERLHAGDEAYVLGSFRTEHIDRKAAVASRAARMLSELKRDRSRMLTAYDADGDGEVDLAEWDVARRDAERAAELELAREGGPSAIHFIGRTGQRRRPFIIACKPQHVLARKYRRRSALAALAAIAGSSAAIWLLYARFGAV